MNALRKVVVVDNGERGAVDMLSTELAELGLSSVTTSYEAAEEVLGIVDRPSAIFLNMPGSGQPADRVNFKRLAAELRKSERMAGIPVIEWDRDSQVAAGGVTAVLRSEIGPQAFSGPEV